MSDKSLPEAEIVSSENVIDFPARRASSNDKAAAMVQAGALNSNELTSVKALTHFVAYNRNMPESVVRSYLQAQFNVTDIANLRRDDFERVIRFLVDMRDELVTIN